MFWLTLILVQDCVLLPEAKVGRNIDKGVLFGYTNCTMRSKRKLHVEKHLAGTKAVRSGLNQTTDQQPLRQMTKTALLGPCTVCRWSLFSKNIIDALHLHVHVTM